MSTMAKKEYIERGALFADNLMHTLPMSCGRSSGRVVVFFDDIESIPAADVVEVVHGEWIFDFELDGSNFYKCSVCGRQEVLLAKESTDEYFPYCHCGAKMDGERKEETP